MNKIRDPRGKSCSLKNIVGKNYLSTYFRTQRVMTFDAIMSCGFICFIQRKYVTLRAALQETVFVVEREESSRSGIGKYCQVCRDEWEIERTLCTRLKFKWRDVEMAVIRLLEGVIFCCYVWKVAAKVLIRRRI